MLLYCLGGTMGRFIQNFLFQPNASNKMNALFILIVTKLHFALTENVAILLISGPFIAVHLVIVIMANAHKNHMVSHVNAMISLMNMSMMKIMMEIFQVLNF